MFKTPAVPKSRRQPVAKRASDPLVAKNPKKSKKSGPCLLDYVDDKVLKMIFRCSMSSDDLKVCKLVCKRFNKVVRKTFPGKAWLWLKNKSYIEDVSIYKEMASGKREIANFAVGESEHISPVTMCGENEFFNDKWFFPRIQSIIGISYRNNINQIQLMNLDVSITNLLKLLSFVDDFHTLKLFFLSKDNTSTETVKVPPDELAAFENVIIYDCGPPIFRMVSYLKGDSIRSLTVKVDHFESLNKCLKKQSAVTKLSLNCNEDVPVPNNLFAGHTFTHLMLDVASPVNLSLFLTQFKETLVFLDIANAINDEVFTAITELENLNKLFVSLNGVSGRKLTEITKLDKLSTLILTGGSSIHLDVLGSLKNLSLSIFDFPGCQPQEAELVKELKKKFKENIEVVIARKGG